MHIGSGKQHILENLTYPVALEEISNDLCIRLVIVKFLDGQIIVNAAFQPSSLFHDCCILNLVARVVVLFFRCCSQSVPS